MRNEHGWKTCICGQEKKEAGNAQVEKDDSKWMRRPFSAITQWRGRTVIVFVVLLTLANMVSDR